MKPDLTEVNKRIVRYRDAHGYDKVATWAEHQAHYEETLKQGS